jgi:uncharacterized protein (TIGR02757 family)
MVLQPYKDQLETLVSRYVSAEQIGSDPVQFVHRYERAGDREMVALIAACLAYGRVAQIHRSVQDVLDRLGDSPADTLREATLDQLLERLEGFRYRFADAGAMAALLGGAGAVLRRDGSLEACFARAVHPAQRTTLIPLAHLVAELDSAWPGRAGHLLSHPTRRSACKRLHLFLRWMVRRDAVDPGGWSCVRADRLIVPLDTHLHRWGRSTGAIRRASATLASALELTRQLATLCPSDPLRYDFALAHAGMEGAD